MRLKFIAPAVLALSLATPMAKAEPALGVGVTILFSGDVAAGIKLFTNNRDRRPTLSLGLDYVFGGANIRPNIGLAYPRNNLFLDGTVGFDWQRQQIDFGAGIGVLCCVRRPGGGGGGGGGGEGEDETPVL